MKRNPFFGEKFLYAGEKYVKGLLGEEWQRLPPISAEIDPTNLCNQNCVWCLFSEYRRRKPVSISPEDMKNVIGLLANAGCKSIKFTGGGEPLCNPKVFPEAFYEVINQGMKCALTSNGVFINKYMKAIAETCTYVKVSMDAGTKETYSYLHGDDSWDIVWENLKALREIYEGDLSTCFLVHPKNHTEVKTFCLKTMHHNLSHAEIRPVLPRLPKEIIVDALRRINDFKREYDFTVFARMSKFRGVTEEKKPFNKCLATPLVAIIGADLNVYLCCVVRGIEKYSFGNLKDDSFEEIWCGDKRKEVVEGIDVDKCLPCRYRRYNVILEKLKSSAHIEFL